MNKQSLIKFDVKLPKLSKSEASVLALLVEAVELVAPLYSLQESEVRHGIGKGEIKKAAKNNPELLFPYTVVQKQKGKLIATPYHIQYAEFLTPIAEKLNEASKITENKEFGRFLSLQAKALVDGSYEDAIKMRLSINPYKLDISIGPVYHRDDKLFYGKASYEAWVGILDVEGTDRFNDYKSTILSIRRKSSMPSERIEMKERLRGKVLDVILFSGLLAKTKFVGVNMPMDPVLVEKYGSELTLFNQANDMRVDEQILPTFKKIFSNQFQSGFENEDLRRGYLRSVAMHELAHSYLYYRHAPENLEDLFQGIYELAATVLGMRMAGSLLLMDRISNKQLESMIVTLIARNFYIQKNGKVNSSMINYSLGGSIFINYLLQNGAIKQFKGVFVPNFIKVFMCLHDLSDILEKLLSTGARKDAERFIKKYEKIKN